AGADVGLAAQSVVGRAGQPGAPFDARINPDLAQGIDDLRALAQHDDVVAVEPAGVIRQVGLIENGLGCAGVSDDVDVPVGDGPGQVDGQAGGGAAVEEHLHVVATGREVDGAARAVINLEGFVVAAALDIFREK